MAGTGVVAGVAFTWLGMVLAISFLEAPLKFRAPDVTVRIGLGIGRIVFRALNTVEVVLAAVLVAAVVWGAPGSVLVGDVLKGTLTTFNALKGTLKTSATPDRRCAPYPRNEAKPATDDNPANVRGHGTSRRGSSASRSPGTVSPARATCRPGCPGCTPGSPAAGPSAAAPA